MVASRPPKRGEVVLVALDPTRGSENRKTRPCVVVSPDEINAHLRTVIVAPLTTGGKNYPFRVRCRFANRSGEVVIDQLRTIDRERVVRHLGRISPATLAQVISTLQEMFAA